MWILQPQGILTKVGNPQTNRVVGALKRAFYGHFFVGARRRASTLRAEAQSPLDNS